jgi:hypothetical protein
LVCDSQPVDVLIGSLLLKLFTLISSSSHFNLVLVLENVEGLSVLNGFSSVLQFQLKESIGDDTYPNVNVFDVTLYCGNRLLDILKWTIITKALTCVIYFALHVSESLIDFRELSLKLLNTLAYGLEIVLNVSETISVVSVVTCHTLEASREEGLFLGDLLKSLGHIVRKSLKLVPDIWKGCFHTVSILLSLVKVASPLFAVGSDLSHSKLIGHSLNLKLPFLSTDR